MMRNTQVQFQTPTLSTDIYAAQDVMGGPLTYPKLALDAGVLHTITILDRDAQAAAIDLHFFKKLPADNVTDQAAFVMSAGNQISWIGTVQIAAVDYKLIGTDQQATIRNVGLLVPMSVNEDGDLYLVPVAVNTPTYTDAADLEIGLGILPG